MSNAEANEGLPVLADEFVLRVEMEGPKDREVPLVLEVHTVGSETSFFVRGPMDERNLVGEAEFERRQARLRKLANIAFWERKRQQDANGRSRRYE